MSRILIITGKGGVGKSSVAAAHAVASAKEGAKTLLVSTDMAHNIADIFQKPVGNHITPLFGDSKAVADDSDNVLAGNLYGLELDPDEMMREEFPDMNRSIAAMFSEAGLSAQKMGSDFIFPGFDDLFSLLKIAKLYESGEYDRIIVDCAPTGETLSLLKLPELLAWYMEKFFPVGKTMVRVLAPISRLRYHIELPSSEAMDDIGRLHERLMELQELFKNDQVTSVRLVCTPERMVVEETKRNYMYMNLYGYQVDGVFINRVLPENVDNAFFEQWREIQAKYIEELESVFDALPVTKIPWFAHEIRGMEAVEVLAGHIFSAETSGSLFDVPVHRDRESYEETDDGYVLVLNVPGIGGKEYQVNRNELDLDITIGNFQRRIPLPNALRQFALKDVNVDGDTIRVHFEGGKEA